MNIQEYIQSGAIESYVLGVADEDDVAELQRLRGMYPEVAAALEAAEKWFEEYAIARGVPAAGDVRENFLQMVKGGSIGSTARIERSRPRTINKYLVAAALILVLVSAGFALYFHRKYDAVVANYAVLSNAAVLKIPLPGVTGKENSSAVLYWDSHNKNVYLDAGHLPKAPAGKQYQLWALVDGKPIDAGVLQDCEGLCQLKTVQKAQAFAITLEKAGGSPTPTLTQMYVLGNVKS